VLGGEALDRALRRATREQRLDLLVAALVLLAQLVDAARDAVLGRQVAVVDIEMARHLCPDLGGAHGHPAGDVDGLQLLGVQPAEVVAETRHARTGERRHDHERQRERAEAEAEAAGQSKVP
jgi:hypothetical protein